MVAEADAEPPTVIGFGDRVVVIVGLALLTVSGWQELVMGLLFASPPYAAFQPYAPALLKVCDADPGTAPFVTATGDPTVIGVPVQELPVKNA
jgi:hypothetical protein